MVRKEIWPSAGLNAISSGARTQNANGPNIIQGYEVYLGSRMFETGVCLILLPAYSAWLRKGPCSVSGSLEFGSFLPTMGIGG
jgi:hypothetical protein